MDAIETILQHRSIRKYKNEPIDEAIITKILESGTRASTTGNMQVYSIVVTKDISIREQLLKCHFGQKMVMEAPLHLTFCADFNRFNKWCYARNADPGYNNFLSFMTSAIDALLAAQNVAIAAESFGLGICYLGTTLYMADEISKILKLPKMVVPITSIVVGYPDESPELTDRLPLEAVIHNETYQDYNNERINELYYEKENSELTKRLIEENKLENLAQIFTYKRYTKKDNEFFSNKLLNFLVETGYLEEQ
jgi:nitroreductase